MLHGYGDNAANFIHLAEPLDLDNWKMHYVALNAPSIMPGNPMGYQWFDLYVNGIYISDLGEKELKLKMKAEERKKKREELERLKQEEEMKKLEELTRPDKPVNK